MFRYLSTFRTRDLVIIIFSLGATYLAIVDIDFRPRYAELIFAVLTGFFALAIPKGLDNP